MTLQEILSQLKIEDVKNNKVKIQGTRKTIPDFKTIAANLLPTHATTIFTTPDNELYKACEEYLASLKAPTEMSEDYAKVVAIYEMCEKVRDMSSKGSNDLVLYNRTTATIEDISEEIIAEALGEKLADIKRKASLGVFEFLPMQPWCIEKYYPRLDTTLKHFNLWSPPPWVHSTPTDIKNPPELIIRLMRSLFPEEESFYYTLSWIHHAVLRRNETVLNMIGPRGTGKSTFINFICHGVGLNYRYQADEHFFKEKFSASELRNKRLTIFEEVEINSDSAVSKFKKITNATVKIEGKGVDGTTENNVTSFILVNNHLDSLKMSPNERRFSVVQLGDKRLEESLSKEEIDYLNKVINYNPNEECPEIIVNFFHWLTKTFKPTHDHINPYKGDYFYRIVWNSLYNWQRELMIYAMDAKTETVFFKDVKKNIEREDKKSKFPNQNTVAKFLGDYLHEGKYRIGEITSSKDTNYRRVYGVKLSEEFLNYVRTEDLSKYTLDGGTSVESEDKPKSNLKKAKLIEEFEAEKLVQQNNEEINGEEYL